MSPVEQKDKENIKESFFSRHLSKSSLWRRLEGDKLHVCILLFLYTLQGIPYGLKFSIPLILTRRGVPYADQARFSISSYPWSMKVSIYSVICHESRQYVYLLRCCGLPLSTRDFGPSLGGESLGLYRPSI